MAKLGAHVIAVARTTGGLEELDDEIQAKGGSGDAGAARSDRL
jgi:short-subunit dehydrogenase